MHACAFIVQVYQWLEEVYDGERVPQYEVNERTIEILYGLMQRNRRRNKHSSLELDDVKQKSHEYSAEGTSCYSCCQLCLYAMLGCTYIMETVFL
jgi:hypothetical protein